MTAHNTLISMKNAAKLAGMEYDTFRAYVKSNRGPAAEMIDGRPFFEPRSVEAWKPVRLKTGRKAKNAPAL
jgi:hypothetical protein